MIIAIIISRAACHIDARSIAGINVLAVRAKVKAVFSTDVSIVRARSNALKRVIAGVGGRGTT